MAEPREPLTERELEIVRLVGTGVANKEIATALHLSPNTIKVHLRNIFTKLEAKSRTEVTVMAARNGWISLFEASQVTNDLLTQLKTPPLTPQSGQQELSESPPNKSSQSSPKGIPDQSANLVQDTRHLIPYEAAPNPEPLAPLVMWQRVLLSSILLFTIALIALSVTPEQTSASIGFDPLRIGPSISRNGTMIRGETSRWYLRAPMPSARARSSVASINSVIYLIGGEVNQSVTGDVLAYLPLTNAWTALVSPKPTSVANSPAAVINGRIYLAGGTTNDGASTDRVESFDPKVNSWRSEPSLPYAMAGHALASLSEKLYLFGGASNQGVTSRSWRFSPDSGVWQPIAPMPTPRTLAAAASFGDSIYVVGGFNAGRELSTCEVYTPTTDSWTSCESMTIPRSGLGLVRLGNSLFAIGGGMTSFMGFNERYDPETNRWTAVDSPFASDWQSIAVVANTTEFYVFGGYSGGERLPLTYVYEVFASRVFVPAFQTASDNK